MCVEFRVKKRYQHRAKRAGHSLLELIVATAIFVMVAVALSGVWVMYGRGLAKSAEVAVAVDLGKSAADEVVSNGWEWLKNQWTTNGKVAKEVALPPTTVERTVRGREANITYHTSFIVLMNEDDGKIVPSNPVYADLSPNLVLIEVHVRWRSNSGNLTFPGSDDNNEIVNSAVYYRYGIGE